MDEFIIDADSTMYEGNNFPVPQSYNRRVRRYAKKHKIPLVKAAEMLYGKQKKVHL